MLDRLLTIEYAEYDERWLLLDVDHRSVGPHVANLVQTLSQARRQGVNVAICNPCFELWLLLHHRSEDQLGGLADCSVVEGVLREVLGGYNKRRLKSDQFNRQSVAEACARARRLDEAEPWSVPEGYAAQVHRLWEAIVSGAAPHQLPPIPSHLDLKRLGANCRSAKDQLCVRGIVPVISPSHQLDGKRAARRGPSGWFLPDRRFLRSWNRFPRFPKGLKTRICVIEKPLKTSTNV